VTTQLDYRYSPPPITALASMVAYALYDVALVPASLAVAPSVAAYRCTSTSRIALLTWLKAVCWSNLSEYHTGFRTYSKELLTSTPLEGNRRT
jgi:hypothetical protein